MEKKALSCTYGVHYAWPEDMRIGHTGAPVCKDCLEDYDNHNAFASCSCGWVRGDED